MRGYAFGTATWTLAWVSALALGAAGAARAAGDEPWVGIWAPEVEWCENDDTSPDGPVFIQPDGHYGYEGQCHYADIARIGPDRWRLVAACRREGTTFGETIEYAVDGDVLRVAYPDREDEVLTYRRCR